MGKSSLTIKRSKLLVLILVPITLIGIFFLTWGLIQNNQEQPPIIPPSNTPPPNYRW